MPTSTATGARAHPYTLTHLAYHARHAGLLDEIVADSDYLVHATPRNLAPHLQHVGSDPARLTAAVYRTGLALHATAPPDVRRQILALDAARAGAHLFHHALASRVPPGHWTPRWATGSTFAPAQRDTFTGHTAPVRAVACTLVDGIPVAVAGGGDGTVRVWDLTTGQAAGPPLTGHTSTISAVACTLVDGIPVAVTGGYDDMVRVWDLTTGQAASTPAHRPHQHRTARWHAPWWTGFRSRSPAAATERCGSGI